MLERVSEYIGDVKEVKWRRQKGKSAKSEVGVYPLYTHRLVGRRTLSAYSVRRVRAACCCILVLGATAMSRLVPSATGKKLLVS